MKIGKDTLSYAGPIAEGLGIMTGSKELRGLGKIAKAFGDVDQHKQTRKDIKTHSNAVTVLLRSMLSIRHQQSLLKMEAL